MVETSALCPFGWNDGTVCYYSYVNRHTCWGLNGHPGPHECGNRCNAKKER